MRRDVTLELVVTRLGTVALAPCVAGFVPRLVGKQAAQQPLGPPTPRPFGSALPFGALRFGLTHAPSVGGWGPAAAR